MIEQNRTERLFIVGYCPGAPKDHKHMHTSPHSSRLSLSLSLARACSLSLALSLCRALSLSLSLLLPTPRQIRYLTFSVKRSLYLCAVLYTVDNILFCVSHALRNVLKALEKHLKKRFSLLLKHILT